MKNFPIAPLLVLIFLLMDRIPAEAQGWKIADGARLITRWGKSVAPDAVLQEYPRPQMVRSEWMNLNGLWEFSTDPDVPRAGMRETHRAARPSLEQILVPFPVESALSGIMRHEGVLNYRRTFRLPENWRGKRILLHFGAVDWKADVFCNDRSVGKHTGGYDPFTCDITDALASGEEQILQVIVEDPTDDTTSRSDPPRGKQTLHPHGIWYTPASGIWQTVWLEPVPPMRIEDLKIVPDLETESVRISVETAGETNGCRLRFSLFAKGKAVARAEGRPGAEIALPIARPRHWSPEDPFLYDLRVELRQGDSLIDMVRSYFGMRSIAIGRDPAGMMRILLNGKPYFQIGPLDQGYWPDGISTAPSEEALRFDIETMKTLGFNMVRKHVKVEPERWYYWCDRLGLLVWQDMPSAQKNESRLGRDQFEGELRRMIETLRNHPSIVMWVIFNEGWGQYDTERLAAMAKKLDPARLVDAASGWTDKNVGDVKDVHNYPDPVAPARDSSRALVLGEFGGLGLAIDGHTWERKHWGYQGVSDREQLTRKYESFLRAVAQLWKEQGLSAAVYTQLTDVETECNGLLTYDRAVLKPVAKRVAAANRGDFSKVPRRVKRGEMVNN